MTSELVKNFTMDLEIEEGGYWIVSPMLVQGLTEDELLEIALGFDYGVLIEFRGDEIDDTPQTISMAGRWCDCIASADFISLRHCNKDNL